MLLSQSVESLATGKITVTPGLVPSFDGSWVADLSGCSRADRNVGIEYTVHLAARFTPHTKGMSPS